MLIYYGWLCINLLWSVSCNCNLACKHQPTTLQNIWDAEGPNRYSENKVKSHGVNKTKSQNNWTWRRTTRRTEKARDLDAESTSTINFHVRYILIFSPDIHDLRHYCYSCFKSITYQIPMISLLHDIILYLTVPRGNCLKCDLSFKKWAVQLG